MNQMYTRAYKLLASVALLVFGVGCVSASPESSGYIMLDLDDFGHMDRYDVIEITRQNYGNMAFIKGRVSVDRILYPEAPVKPYVGYGDGEIFPCTNDPFDAPPEEYPTHERVRAGLVPNPWFFKLRFDSSSDDSAYSVSMDAKFKSLLPVEEVALSDIHGKCVTLLVKVTGERSITSIAASGILYIHNIYDTESNLEGVQQLRTP